MKASLLLLALAAAPALLADDLPEGKGKDLVAKQCTACHGIEHVTAHRDSKDGWDSVVAYMVSRGMPAADADITVMVDYLAKAFPPEKKLSSK
jgi:mono/diheme cytochrome c family protein